MADQADTDSRYWDQAIPGALVSSLQRAKFVLTCLASGRDSDESRETEQSSLLVSVRHGRLCKGLATLPSAVLRVSLLGAGVMTKKRVAVLLPG